MAAIQGWRRTGGKKLGQEIDWERGGGVGEPLAPQRERGTKVAEISS